nr:VRR-NUC domain-containing protein [Rhodoferax sp.]
MSRPLPGASDLFGMAASTKRTNDRPEAAALTEVLMALRAHPAVVWCERMNSGAVKVGSRFIRFGWHGCPDVLGQLRDGRLLGVEVKAPKGKLRPEQAVFLERIKGAGGVGFMARDLRDVHRELDQFPPTGHSAHF